MDEPPGIAWQTITLWKKMLPVKDYLISLSVNNRSIRLPIRYRFAEPIIERQVL